MNNFEVFFYFVCFAVIAGGAFALMWSNIQSINVEMNKPKPLPQPSQHSLHGVLFYCIIYLLTYSTDYERYRKRVERSSV